MIFENTKNTTTGMTHRVHEKTYYYPKFCDYCKKILVGVIKQGVKCEICKGHFHNECYNLTSCEPLYVLNDKNLKGNTEVIHDTEKTKQVRKDRSNGDAEQNLFQSNEDRFEQVRKMSVKYVERRKRHLCGRNKKRNSPYLWEGCLSYTVDLNDEKVLAHNWKLNETHLWAFENNDDLKVVCEIPLESIDRIVYDTQDKKRPEESRFKYKFHLRTNEHEYHFLIVENGFVQENLSSFYNILRLAYLPFDKNCKKSRIFAPTYEGVKTISDEYEIFVNDEIGRGTFGKVYAGVCKETKQNVAIKVIDSSFGHQMTLYNCETTILCNLKHPGIVKILSLFQNDESLYIVMERLRICLFDKIISKKRLNERSTKFIIYQILKALQYMHEIQIGHCDLKPENILLTEDIDLPQVKLCDFGYSRVIGPNSFRKTTVGTQVYNPPEVTGHLSYNKSVDTWALGLITYVCLSGGFPFDEKMPINEQIKDSDFLFPDDPWKQISKDAVNLIREELLQIRIYRRPLIPKILKNKWFIEDCQLYFDLKDLEKRVGVEWISDQLKTIFGED